MSILAITNQKGGVGKTTSVINIGTYLAVAGKKVLLVDIDPQANLTSGIGTVDSRKYPSTYDILINKKQVQDVIKPTRIKNLFILPSSIELAGAEVELVNTLSRENVLKRALEEAKKDFDFVLIDCPPSLGLLTINGLVAADGVLIPVQSEYFALEGLGQLINTVNLIRSSINGSLEVFGVIITMFDTRTNLSHDVSVEVKEFFKEKTFNTFIPRNIKLSEAPSRGLSVYEYAPKSPGALAYSALAKEIIQRFK